MARLVHQYTYPTLPLTRPADFGRVFIVLMQLAVLGGIGLFLALAVVNTILGTGQPDSVSAPYS